jgi:hypothetical protein
MKISAFYGIQGFIYDSKLGQTCIYAVYLIPEGLFYEAIYSALRCCSYHASNNTCKMNC